MKNVVFTIKVYWLTQLIMCLNWDQTSDLSFACATRYQPSYRESERKKWKL